MRTVKVTYFMCENDSGGFTTGISNSGTFTENEFNSNKHERLIKYIKLLNGCYWSMSLKWSK